MKILSLVGIILAVTCYLEGRLLSSKRITDVAALRDMKPGVLKKYGFLDTRKKLPYLKNYIRNLTQNALQNLKRKLESDLESSALRCKEDDEEPWSYNGYENGPSAWGEDYPACYGKSQSPIDIEIKKVIPDRRLKHLVMTNYNVTVQKAEIINNGHTVMITPKDDVARTIVVDGETFKLAQLHFHWGSHYDVGTEHLFNSKAYAIESHFVHTNDDGDIAVVGVLYQEAHTNNTGFKPISEALPQIRFKNDQTLLRSHINLSKLLPRLPLRIYRYTGSLTTPGCNEGVIWSVAQDISRIGTRQLVELRSLYSVTRDTDHSGCHLQDNYRPVQPLNGRKVTSST